MIFAIATFAFVLYSIFEMVKSGEFQIGYVIITLIIPVLFTGLLYGFDRVFDWAFNKFSKGGKQTPQNEYNAFLEMINKVVDNNTNFTLEEYRRLRINERFQKSLKQVFTIYKEGENSDLSYDYLRHKFKKNSIEFVVMNVIIDEVKKLEKNS